MAKGKPSSNPRESHPEDDEPDDFDHLPPIIRGSKEPTKPELRIHKAGTRNAHMARKLYDKQVD